MHLKNEKVKLAAGFGADPNPTRIGESTFMRSSKSSPIREALSERRDRVDIMVDQWADERPEVDLLPYAVMARLHRAGSYVGERIAEAATSVGLTMNDLLVLNALRRAGPPYSLTPSELLDSLMVTPSAVTKRVDSLAALGYVQRRPNPNDGRGQRIGLTKTGRMLTDRTGPDDAARRVSAGTGGLSRGELQTLNNLLRKYLIPFECQATVSQQ